MCQKKYIFQTYLKKCPHPQKGFGRRGPFLDILKQMGMGDGGSRKMEILFNCAEKKIKDTFLSMNYEEEIFFNQEPEPLVLT